MGGGEKTRWGCVPNRYSEQENKTETRDNTLKQVCSYSIIMNEEEAWGWYGNSIFVWDAKYNMFEHCWQWLYKEGEELILGVMLWSRQEKKYPVSWSSPWIIFILKEK